MVLFRMALALVDTYSQALLATCESSDAFMLLQVGGRRLGRGDGGSTGPWVGAGGGAAHACVHVALGQCSQHASGGAKG